MYQTQSIHRDKWHRDKKKSKHKICMYRISQFCVCHPMCVCAITSTALANDFNSQVSSGSHLFASTDCVIQVQSSIQTPRAMPRSIFTVRRGSSVIRCVVFALTVSSSSNLPNFFTAYGVMMDFVSVVDHAMQIGEFSDVCMFVFRYVGIKIREKKNTCDLIPRQKYRLKLI